MRDPIVVSVGMGALAGLLVGTLFSDWSTSLLIAVVWVIGLVTLDRKMWNL